MTLVILVVLVVIVTVLTLIVAITVRVLSKVEIAVLYMYLQTSNIRRSDNNKEQYPRIGCCLITETEQDHNML